MIPLGFVVKEMMTSTRVQINWQITEKSGDKNAKMATSEESRSKGARNRRTVIKGDMISVDGTESKESSSKQRNIGRQTKILAKRETIIAERNDVKTFSVLLRIRLSWSRFASFLVK